MAIWIKDDPAKLLFIACMSDGEASQKLKITGGTKVQTILRQQQVWKHVIIM
jgi:hypothetical protein